MTNDQNKWLAGDDLSFVVFGSLLGLGACVFNRMLSHSFQGEELVIVGIAVSAYATRKISRVGRAILLYVAVFLSAALLGFILAAWSESISFPAFCLLGMTSGLSLALISLALRKVIAT